jgi:hypothetical protein
LPSTCGCILFEQKDLIEKEASVNQAHSPGRRDRVVLCHPHELLPHENHDPIRARALAREIRAAGFWMKPLLVEADHRIILDGHHRREAARQLGLSAVPALMIHYDDPRLTLTAWRPGEVWSREDVIARALARDLCPIKTTRHCLYPAPEVAAVNLRQFCSSRCSQC